MPTTQERMRAFFFRAFNEGAVGQVPVRDDTQDAGFAWGAGGAGGGGAPTTAQYITSAADAALSAERVLTDTATVTWDFSVAGQAKATATAAGSGVAFGVATAVFGAGSRSSTLVSVADPGVTSTSRIVATVAAPVGRAADELELAPLDVYVTGVVAGFGFSLLVVCRMRDATGNFPINYMRS